MKLKMNYLKIDQIKLNSLNKSNLDLMKERFEYLIQFRMRK